MTALVRKAGSATEPGEITLDPQVIAGAKTFNAAMTMGATVSTSISGAQHLVNGAFNCGATGTTDAAKRFGINCNVNVNQTWTTSRNSASSTLGGSALFLIARTSDATQSFQLYSNLASDNDSANPVLTLSSNQRGEWTAGRSDTINLSTVYQHTFISGGRTQLDITSTGNAASTGGAAVLRLRATGESGAQFSWYRGTDGGTFDTNATIKWNWVHGGNGALMTGGGVDSIAFYSYGIGNYMGQLCYDGRWYIGPEAGGVTHNIKGRTKFGPAAWPISAFGESGSRIVATDDQEGGAIFIHTTNTIAAGNQYNIYLGARATSSGNDFAGGVITGGKENSTNTDGSGYLKFKTTNGGGTVVEKGSISSGGSFVVGPANYTGSHTMNGTTFFAGAASGGAQAYAWSQSQTISAGANGDFTIGSGGTTGTIGLLIVYVVRSAIGSITTMTNYSLFGNGLTTATLTSIATANGSGGAATHTVTVLSNNPTVIRVNNTSANTEIIQVGFYGLQGG